MGIKERKQREKDQRIQDIIEAARELFITKGYDKTTMLDIAEKAELSRRTLYHYFPSKEDISHMMIYEAYMTLKGIFDKALSLESTSGFEKFRILKNAFINYYSDYIDQFAITLLLDQEINILSDPSENAVKCLTIINSLIEDIAKVIELGIRDGSIQQIGPPNTTAVTIISMIQATMQKIYIRQKWVKSSFDVDAKSIINTMFDLILSGIDAKRGASF